MLIEELFKNEEYINSLYQDGESRDKFPKILLEKNTEERRKYFNNLLVPHPLLIQTTQEVLDNISSPSRVPILSVIGGTRIGKTTVLHKTASILFKNFIANHPNNNNDIPFGYAEVIPPDQVISTFRWKSTYTSILDSMYEILVDKKTDNPFHPPSRSGSSEAALRASLINALNNRHVDVVFLDEAHHLCYVAHKLIVVENLKSLSNQTNAIIILFGTYELRELINLNPQLSVRTKEIHFPRYGNTKKDVNIYTEIIGFFQEHFPIEEKPNLVDYSELLLKSSAGCVGLLKYTLNNLLSIMLSYPNYKKISLERLINISRLSNSKLWLILDDFDQNEKYFENSPTPAKYKLMKEDEELVQKGMENLGFEGKSQSPDPTPQLIQTDNKAEKITRKPGKQKPIRFLVGSAAKTSK